MSTKYKEHKIVFAGPTGAGKTTAIRAVSEVTPISTEAYASDEVREQKETTTVALDYGELSLSQTEVLRLYGTPGQERFSHMWQMLCRGAMGTIFLMDNSRADPISDLAFYLDRFAPLTEGQAAVVGVTRFQHGVGPSIEEYHRRLARPTPLPILSADIRNGSDVLMLIDTLMLSLEFPYKGG